MILSGQRMNYNKYYDFIKTMDPPVMPSELPKVKIRLRDMAKYARDKGVKVSDLTEEEKNMFIDKEKE